jgi:CBS domain-containing protein
MIPIEQTPALSGKESARTALAQLHESAVDELPVYDGAELVGIITRDSIFRRLHAGASF